MNTRDKMNAAREHIQAKRYDEARAILTTIDHPKAREWLDKLPSPTASGWTWKQYRWVVIAGVVLLLVAAMLYSVEQSRRASEVFDVVLDAQATDAHSTQERELTVTVLMVQVLTDTEDLMATMTATYAPP